MTLEKNQVDLLQRFEEELRHLFDDPRWRRLSGAKLYFREIDGIRIGAVLATYLQRYNNFALHCPEVERVRHGKAAGKIDQTNGTGQYEHRGYAEADALYEKLRHRPTINGSF